MISIPSDGNAQTQRNNVLDMRPEEGHEGASRGIVILFLDLRIH
jgi:hypothetical protein